MMSSLWILIFLMQPASQPAAPASQLRGKPAQRGSQRRPMRKAWRAQALDEATLRRGLYRPEANHDGCAHGGRPDLRQQDGTRGWNNQRSLPQERLLDDPWW